MNRDRWITVTIDRTLIEPIDRFIEEAKNEFGGRLYDSRAEFVSKAIMEKLKQVEVTN